MRTIRRTARFKKDYRRERRGRYAATLDEDLVAVVTILVSDQPLPARCRDHALSGEWRDHRDCHIHPDLVLIYRKPDSEFLDLVRLGSHSALSL
ncbi:type II toxin-antitoxin system YafQ family toxin [Prosthecomicrobium pneumaticum]|uniref:mRNA interferase YafQ n=1 Tax=Prosthecomicrobium pneumaticum TaxID=81895 RepID=A0A7W9FQQ0_9HYPH|nr:type II toxin-antitoxin system YafQ family toxin [Prosthecomicrobium pneumaticum]MBB5755042.1 mRNA interferase YafQ [Prosthecomicrobium pneumaticum]